MGSGCPETERAGSWRDKLRKINVRAFWESFIIGLVMALALGWFLVKKPGGPQDPHYVALVLCLLALAVGCGISEVPDARDWFGLGSMERWSAKQIIFGIVAGIGMGLGMLVDVIWRAAFH